MTAHREYEEGGNWAYHNEYWGKQYVRAARTNNSANNTQMYTLGINEKPSPVDPSSLTSVVASELFEDLPSALEPLRL